MTLAANEPTLLALMALEYAACCLQAIHVPLRAAGLHPGGRALPLAHELGVAAHLTMAACFTLAAEPLGQELAASVLSSPWAPYLWLNAAAALLALLAAVRERRPLAALEGLLMALCTPPALRALGAGWLVVAFADVSLFLARSVGALGIDYLRHGESPTGLSVVETINVVPVGILVTDATGRPLVMNNAMRTLLERLGCPTDLGDLSDLWGLLAGHAHPLHETPSDGDQAAAADQLVVPDTFGGVTRVTRTASPDGRTFYLAEGITEQYLANQRLGQANAQLEQAAETLRARLADVGAIAEGEAYLRMRQRVHDVVGQRLSILHRYLEQGRLDERSVAELTALLTSIPLDLRGQAADANASLEAVIEAFSLVDVTIRVTGELPENAEVARVFVQTIREAATNACRHGHAHTVSVAAGSRTDERRERWAVLLVTDDGSGTPDGTTPPEGSGIAGMRRTLAGVGGMLHVIGGCPFTLYAEAPEQAAGPTPNSTTHSCEEAS